MKRNGFTLIELIGTVVILAIIALVVLPATLSVMKQGQDEVDKSVIQVVESAANNYVNDNKNLYPKQLETLDKGTEESRKSHGTIPTQELVNKGYLENSLYNKNEDALKNSCVKITSNSKRYFTEFTTEGC